MKLYFTGSDTMLLNEFPKQLPRRKIFYVLLYRFFIWLSRFCTEEYWVVHEHLIKELKGIKREKIKVVQHPYNETKFPKVEHKGFTVLYYIPKDSDKWNEWIYGYDIFQQVRSYYWRYNEVKFMIINGTQDMSQVWPVTDFYLRCNRHDGGARLVDEAKVNEVPYYWSYENPSVEEIIKSIENARANRHTNR